MGDSKNTPILLGVFAMVTVFSLLTASIVITPAFALTRYFNCITRIANKTGQLTLDDVNTCYDKVFPGKANSG